MVLHLEGRLARLRSLTREDLNSVALWDGDEEVTRFSGRKFTKEAPEGWFSRYIRSNRTRALAIESLDGKLIGDLELEEINWRAGTAELRITIGEKDYWNRGYGTDAVQQALRLAFVGLKLRLVYLRVYTSNVRAIRVYQNCGFSREGLLKAGSRRTGSQDILLMSLRRETFLQSAAAEAPRPVA